MKKYILCFTLSAFLAVMPLYATEDENFVSEGLFSCKRLMRKVTHMRTSVENYVSSAKDYGISFCSGVRDVSYSSALYLQNILCAAMRTVSECSAVRTVTHTLGRMSTKHAFLYSCGLTVGAGSAALAYQSNHPIDTVMASLIPSVYVLTLGLHNRQSAFKMSCLAVGSAMLIGSTIGYPVGHPILISSLCGLVGALKVKTVYACNLSYADLMAIVSCPSGMLAASSLTFYIKACYEFGILGPKKANHRYTSSSTEKVMPQNNCPVFYEVTSEQMNNVQHCAHQAGLEIEHIDYHHSQIAVHEHSCTAEGNTIFKGADLRTLSPQETPTKWTPDLIIQRLQDCSEQAALSVIDRSELILRTEYNSAPESVKAAFNACRKKKGVLTLMEIFWQCLNYENGFDGMVYGIQRLGPRCS